jgi:hypothetical protein
MAVVCANPNGWADLERAAVTRLMTAFEDRTEAFEWMGISVKEISESAR